jgi:pimeloyl-ACP methyl ester carboxylesterase
VIFSARDIERIAAMPMTYHSKRFRVHVTGIPGEIEIAAWVFAPPKEAITAEPLVLDLAAGAMRDKRTWHFVPSPQDGSYSFAQYLCVHARCIVVAQDHLGTGESSRPADGAALSLDVLAEVRAQVVAQVRAELAAGTLVPDLPPLPCIHLGAVGLGIGAAILHRVQARFRSYEQVAFLGWTHTSPQGGALDPETFPQAFSRQEHGYLEWSPAARQALHSLWYWPDVPQHIRQVDEQQATVMPSGMLATFTPGAVVADARKITVPVFLGYGEQDISRDPAQEAQYYPQAQVTTFTLAGSAHSQHLATTRLNLWKAIGWWQQSSYRQTLMASSPNMRSE